MWWGKKRLIYLHLLLLAAVLQFKWWINNNPTTVIVHQHWSIMTKSSRHMNFVGFSASYWLPVTSSDIPLPAHVSLSVLRLLFFFSKTAAASAHSLCTSAQGTFLFAPNSSLQRNTDGWVTACLLSAHLLILLTYLFNNCELQTSDLEENINQ